MSVAKNTVAQRSESQVLDTKFSTPPMIDRLEDRKMMSVVLPGGTVALHGTTEAARPELAGTVIRDTLVPLELKVGSKVIFKGFMQDRVVRETKTGTLDFYECIRASSGFDDRVLVQSVARTSFATVTTDVDYRTDGIGATYLHPSSAIRSATRAIVDFKFSNTPIAPNEDSQFFFIKTNAKQFVVEGKTTVTMATTSGQVATETIVTADPLT